MSVSRVHEIFDVCGGFSPEEKACILEQFGKMPTIDPILSGTIVFKRFDINVNKYLYLAAELLKAGYFIPVDEIIKFVKLPQLVYFGVHARIVPDVLNKVLDEFCLRVKSKLSLSHHRYFLDFFRWAYRITHKRFFELCIQFDKLLLKASSQKQIEPLLPRFLYSFDKSLRKTITKEDRLHMLFLSLVHGPSQLKITKKQLQSFFHLLDGLEKREKGWFLYNMKNYPYSWWKKIETEVFDHAVETVSARPVSKEYFLSKDIDTQMFLVDYGFCSALDDEMMFSFCTMAPFMDMDSEVEYTHIPRFLELIEIRRMLNSIQLDTKEIPTKNPMVYGMSLFLERQLYKPSGGELEEVKRLLTTLKEDKTKFPIVVAYLREKYKKPCVGGIDE